MINDNNNNNHEVVKSNTKQVHKNSENRILCLQSDGRKILPKRGIIEWEYSLIQACYVSMTYIFVIYLSNVTSLKVQSCSCIYIYLLH